MAFDLFSLIRNNLSPSQKVSNAIREKNVSQLEEILQSGFSVNSRVLEQGGYTALHLAVQPESYDHSVVEKLIECNADPSLPNDFGITPIHTAAEGNNVELVRFLLMKDRSSNSIDSFWNSVSRTLEYGPVSPQNLTVILLATPRFTKYSQTISQRLWSYIVELPNRFLTCEKLMLILDNRLQTNQNPENEADKEINEWMKSYKHIVPTLQHCCRMSIRQAFDGKCNIIYGVERLILPNTLKQFLRFTDVTSLGL